MNCPTKRYWITYFTNKGDHLLYFDHWLTVSWFRYDKRLKPPSEGALRVRSSPQRLLHPCLFAFASYFAYSNLHPLYPILTFFLITLRDDHAHILCYCLILHPPPLRSTSACPSSPSPPRTSRACTTRSSSSSSRSGSTLAWSTTMETGERKKIKSSFHGFLLRYPTLNALHHHGDIWKPDIYFIKHGTFKVNRLNHPSRMDFMQTHLST